MSLETLTDVPDLAANEYFLAKNAAEVLHKHYPGHLWGVSVCESVLDVRNMALAGNWGFRLTIPAIYSISDWDKQIMRAGGALLEHYKQRRGQVDWRAITELPVDFAGNHKPDV